MLNFFINNIFAFALFSFILLTALCMYLAWDYIHAPFPHGFTLSRFGSSYKSSKIFSINIIITAWAIFYFEYGLLSKGRNLFSQSEYYMLFFLAFVSLVGLLIVAIFPYVKNFKTIHVSGTWLFVLPSIVFVILISTLRQSYLGIAMGILSFVIPAAFYFITKKFTMPDLSFIFMFVICMGVLA